MKPRWSIAMVGLATLILNPFYACSRERTYTFSAEDMRNAVEGTWTLAVGDRHYILHVAQARELEQKHSSRGGVVDSAHACGKRTLVKSADACADLSMMPLVVEVSGEVSNGMFTVDGLTFREGFLEITVAGQEITARVAPDGTATPPDGTLVRSSRR